MIRAPRPRLTAALRRYPCRVGEPNLSQLPLFGTEEPACDESFRLLERVVLDDGAWIEIVPGWLRGHARVFETLLERTRWRSEERKMYDRVVDVPRLYAVLPDDGPGHPVIQRMRQAPNRRYET